MLTSITVEDLPPWHVLHTGFAGPRGLSPQERESPLRVIEHHVCVSCLGNELPACGYSAALLAARALMHTADWPSVAFALRAAHNPDLFQSAVGGQHIEAPAVVGRLRNALWACGQADAFAKEQSRRMRPWINVLELAHCVGALEAMT